MVEELKHQMRSLENLIGCKGKFDVTSGEFIRELIRALCSKYQSDLKNSVRLHRLELLYDLAENIRLRHQKESVEEAVVLPSKKIKKSSEEEPENKEQSQEPEKAEKAVDIVTVKPQDIDDWKDLMILSKIYYIMEHPRPEVLKWKRRIAKKKVIQKFGDKDFIEWRVAQNFRLRSLEAWAQSRSDARKLVDEDSPLSEDEELEELGTVFPILSDGKQKKTKRKKEEWRKPQKPFKFKDENIEDWTESYSDDSEEMEDEKERGRIAEVIEEPEPEIDDLQPVDEELLEKAEEKIAEIFSVYRTFTKHRNPIFEEIDKAETIDEWYELLDKAIGKIEEQKDKKQEPLRLLTIGEDDSEDKPFTKELASTEMTESNIIEEEAQKEEITTEEATVVETEDEFEKERLIDRKIIDVETVPPESEKEIMKDNKIPSEKDTVNESLQVKPISKENADDTEIAVEKEIIADDNITQVNPEDENTEDHENISEIGNKEEKVDDKKNADLIIHKESVEADLVTENESVDYKEATDLATEQKIADDKEATHPETEKKTADDKEATDLATEKKIADDKEATDLATEKKIADDKEATDLVTEKKTADDKEATDLESEKKIADDSDTLQFTEKAILDDNRNSVEPGDAKENMDYTTKIETEKHIAENDINEEDINDTEADKNKEESQVFSLDSETEKSSSKIPSEEESLEEEIKSDSENKI